MAVTETRILPPEFIEAAGKTYLGDLATAQVDIKQLIYLKHLVNNLLLVKILYKHKLNN